jgi:LssY C-terminus
MNPFLGWLLAAQAVIWNVAPVGTPLHVRLIHPVGSYASRLHSRVEAVLIAPMKSRGETIIPAGSLVRGEVKSVRRVGLGLLHEDASMQLDFREVSFNSISGAASDEAPLSAQVSAVDNGREVVTAAGSIQEARSTGSLGNRAARYVRMALLWDVHVQLVVWAVKALVVQVPEPEIYLPAGTELTLTLSAPVIGAGVVGPSAGEPRLFTEQERESLIPVTAALPERTSAGNSERPADLVNVLLIGSREEIAAAFTAAGWMEARPSTARSSVSSAWAVVRHTGYPDAPMSPLFLNGAPADMSWQKGFNDVSKRHHIRMWKQPDTMEGQEVWAGAATRDIDFAYLRGNGFMTHEIARKVDQERDKVADDIAFASCAEAVDWWDREQVPHQLTNATGDRMDTDGRLVVVRLKDRDASPNVAAAADAALNEDDALPRHGGRWHCLLRREIICARSDLIRANIYWRTYEAVRTLIAEIAQHRRALNPDAPAKETLASRWYPDRLNTIVSYR